MRDYDCCNHDGFRHDYDRRTASGNNNRLDNNCADHDGYASRRHDPGAPITTTVIVTTTDQALTDRVAALEQNYASLAARVDAIAAANTASWDAFSQTIAAGGTVADAALAARSAGWNAIYQLG